MPIPAAAAGPARASSGERRRGERRTTPFDPVVLHIASEAMPWASTGGLGDVVGSLPAAQRQLGWDARVCLPLYAGALAGPLKPPLLRFEIGVGAGRFAVAIREALAPPSGVPTYFVECNALFNRPGIYGDGHGSYGDNPLRYGVFQLAALHLAASLSPAPAILHSHDWHAALVPALVELDETRPPALADARTVLTLHNLQYQGHTGRDLLGALSLPAALWHPAHLEHFGGANPLKAGILAADRVTTVSRTYADEIRTPEGGMGLDGPLVERGADFAGILNGIDAVSWDPATDDALAAGFSAERPDGRARCTEALRREMGLPDAPGVPLLGVVSRLTDAKGVDVLLGALPRLLAQPAQMVVLGSGERGLQDALAAAAAAYPRHLRVVLRFDPQLARRIYAGADLVLVPSRREPCGLVQLYALRYGAVPVVRATGGLVDTVSDGETGFMFRSSTGDALLAAVERALAVWRTPALWARVRAAAMSRDFSWPRSARAYDALYRAALASPPRRRAPPAPADDLGDAIDWGPELTARRGGVALRLLSQGPRCVYAFWEAPEGAEPLELVIEERPSATARVVSPDRPSLGEYWLPASPEAAYRATLRRRADGRVVATSNVVITPRDAAAAPGEATPAWLEELLSAMEEAARGHGARGEGAAWQRLFGGPAREIEGAGAWAAGFAMGALGPGGPSGWGTGSGAGAGAPGAGSGGWAAVPGAGSGAGVADERTGGRRGA